MHAECPDHESDVENRLPKNQWLMYRRICSLPDESKKHTILIEKSHVSAKEQIRLDINHWFFCRRNLTCESLKTIFKARGAQLGAWTDQMP